MNFGIQDRPQHTWKNIKKLCETYSRLEIAKCKKKQPVLSIHFWHPDWPLQGNWVCVYIYIYKYVYISGRRVEWFLHTTQPTAGGITFLGVSVFAFLQFWGRKLTCWRVVTCALYVYTYMYEIVYIYIYTYVCMCFLMLTLANEVTTNTCQSQDWKWDEEYNNLDYKVSHLIIVALFLTICSFSFALS